METLKNLYFWNFLCLKFVLKTTVRRGYGPFCGNSVIILQVDNAEFTVFFPT